MYLSTLFSDFSRSYIQKIIDNGEVKVNWKVITKNLKISYKDEIEVQIQIEKLELQAQNIPLDIVYQDENIAIINKDAGINTHPTPWIDGKSGTLVNALLYHIKDLSSIGGVERPWIVHRLDKDTSWLIMIAKNDQMMVFLQNLLKDKKHISKYYLALVKWHVEEQNFKIESFIGRHPIDKTRMTSAGNAINPKIAITYGKVVKYIDDMTLLELKIETWRTHQIRVHLSAFWYPIVGDKVYGDKQTNEQALKKFWLTRQALHSYRLEFELYGEPKVFLAELKDDMKKIIWEI